MKHITSCPGTLPAQGLSRKSPARPDRRLRPSSFFSSLIPSSYKTGLMASLLVTAACFPPAMLAQDGYSATATVVYVAANGSNDLLSTSGSPGGWTTGTPVTGQQSPIAPAMTRFGEYLVLAYVANNGSDDLLVTFSEDSINWTKSVRVTGQFSALSPALTVFNDKLVLAYVANNGSDDLLVTFSTNGVTWSKSAPVTGQTSSVTPALAVMPNPIDSPTPFTTFNLILVYVANNGSNDLLVTTSVNGVNWTPSTQITGQSSRVAPAIRISESYNPD